MTSPPLIGGPLWSGTCSETYCSPKSVFGRICAETLFGISLARDGLSASVMDEHVPVGSWHSPCESTFTLSTRPTMMPRSLTSESFNSWLPV